MRIYFGRLARFVFPNLTGDNGNGPSPAIGGHQPKLRHGASAMVFGSEHSNEGINHNSQPSAHNSSIMP